MSPRQLWPHCALKEEATDVILSFPENTHVCYYQFASRRFVMYLTFLKRALGNWLPFVICASEQGWNTGNKRRGTIFILLLCIFCLYLHISGVYNNINATMHMTYHVINTSWLVPFKMTRMWCLALKNICHNNWLLFLFSQLHVAGRVALVGWTKAWIVFLYLAFLPYSSPQICWPWLCWDPVV